jgi:hypothetical protein
MPEVVTPARQLEPEPPTIAPDALGSQPEPAPKLETPETPAQRPAAREHEALDEELLLLAAAHAALRDGIPERALVQLAEHAWRFPDGQLAESRDVARMLALCRAGKVQLSHSEASKFLSRNPRSPFARRVRSICR